MKPSPGGFLKIASCVVVLGMSGRALAEVPINIYGNTDYAIEKKDGRTSGTFSVPMVDIFATQQLDRIHFLTEIVLEAGADTNEFEIDVERLQVDYQATSWLRVAGGRFHTAMGYYNDAFHHGAYFVLPVGRPEMVEFEDGGGLIPAHSVGLHADGRIAFSEKLRLRYDFEIANGRGVSSTSVANVQDANRSKAMNVRLRLEPGGILDGLLIGANGYVDRIPPDATGASPEMKEVILGLHLAYFEHSIHLISELNFFRHEEVLSGVTHNTRALFAEVGYQFGDFTPYVRFEATKFPTSLDPYFVAAAAGSYKTGAVGVRWIASGNLAFKLQGRAKDYEVGGNIYDVNAQCAFAF